MQNIPKIGILLLGGLLLLGNQRFRERTELRVNELCDRFQGAVKFTGYYSLSVPSFPILPFFKRPEYPRCQFVSSVFLFVL